MTEPIEDLYFGWLYAKVARTERSTPSNTYHKLFHDMHETKFVWTLSGDDNRSKDGIDLRRGFLNNTGYRYIEEWMALECSVLELLIAFSRRAEFQTEIPSSDWFWRMLDNLGLGDISDGVYEMEAARIDPILDNLVWRTYTELGMNGGLFPLRQSENDQRGVEIWYQFCEFVEENDIY